MKKFLLSIAAAVAALMVVSAVSYAASGSWNGWWLFVKKGVAIGVNSGTARLTVKGDGTNDIASFQNSSGTEVLEIGSAGAATVSTTLTVAGKATVNDAVLIDGDADEVQLVMQSHSTQNSNLVEGQASDGSTDWYIADNGVFSVATLTASGAVTAAGATLTGDISIDGTAGLDAESIVIDGNTLTFVEGLLTACSGAGCP